MNNQTYCNNCGFHHDLYYTGNNEIKNRSNGLNNKYSICQKCQNAILKKHFKENKFYFERCDRS